MASQISGSVINASTDECPLVNLPLLLLWGSCQGKLYCSLDISKLQTIKFPPGKLPREKSATLEKFSFSRETVNQSSFPRAKVCGVTTAIIPVFQDVRGQTKEM